MIYSPRAPPQVNESQIHEVPKNNGLIFHMAEVSELWHKTMVNVSSFVVLKSRPVFRSQKLRKRSSRQEFQKVVVLFVSAFNAMYVGVLQGECF